MNYRRCALAFLMIVIASCNKDKTSKLQGNWLFPIAKGNVSLNTLNELKNVSYNIDVPPLSIGQPVNVPVSSPGLYLAHVGPFPLEISSWLHRIDIDTMEVTGSLNNVFPIPVGAGTKISVRNSRDTTSAANLLGSTTITSDVPPGGLLSFDFKFTNKSIGDSVYFFLDDFNSPPYANVTFASTPSKMKVTLKVLTASYVEIYSNRTFSSIDTVDFNAGSDDQLGSNTGGVISDTGISGNINLFLDNSFPANIVSQIYFLNESRTQVLDSLFTTPFAIDGVQTDATGNPLSTVSKAYKILVTQKKINNIKAAKYAITSFRLNTFGYTSPWVSANKNAKLAIQLTGDLNIRINF